MAGEVKRVGEGTYRESFGRYFEDFQVAISISIAPGEFGRCIVCSPLTVALMVGMSVNDVSQKAIANLGWTDIKLTQPRFAGETLYAESEVLDKRESKSRPGAGIMSVKTIGLNQERVKVCEFNRTMLIMKRSGNDIEVKAND